ncbi:COP1-interactive protein 1-like [Camellia sinensis]|uniref:COP1-interactive protein 1-like n=1 Tax=Camellia sinensis TaxID=4442 RepID=UPI001035685D|nr:COP1-interactive protein 1-like [Camellia sinensis]
MDQQVVIKKPSKFSRILRSIFGSCGGKSVEKTLVEDEKDGNTDYFSSASSFGLDSDSAYSSKEKGSKNGELQNEFQMVTDNIKQELQVADLKRELTETTEEKEVEKMISDLKMEAETLNGENSKLLQELVTECSQLREKLGERERELASHTEIHKTHKSETSARMRDLELELDSLRTQKGDEVKLLMENLSAIEEDYGYFESRLYEIMNAFQGAKNRVRELEEQLRGKTHETETDQMPGVQEEEERKSYEDEDEDEDEDDDFEFPTFADEIKPIFPFSAEMSSTEFRHLMRLQRWRSRRRDVRRTTRRPPRPEE